LLEWQWEKKVIPFWKDELDFSECDSGDSACVDYIAESGAADFFAKKAVDKAGYAPQC
jgi:hypothetical protein